MTTRPGGRSERVRRAVLEATLDELAEHGDAGFSMERVAARAGVNKTSIYRRWGDRRALVAAALRSAPADEQEPPDTGSLRGDLLALGLAYASSFAGNPRAAAITRVVAASADPEVIAAQRELFARRRDHIALVCSRAAARGEVDDPDVDLVCDVLFGAGRLRTQLDPDGDLRPYIERLNEFVLRALGVADTHAAG